MTITKLTELLVNVCNIDSANRFVKESNGQFRLRENTKVKTTLNWKGYALAAPIFTNDYSIRAINRTIPIYAATYQLVRVCEVIAVKPRDPRIAVGQVVQEFELY